MTIIEKLKQICKDTDDFPWIMIRKIRNWPLIKVENYTEALDLENWKVIEIKDDYLVMQCGGDWQQPHEIKIELDINNDFRVSYCEPCEYDGKEINVDKLLGI